MKALLDEAEHFRFHGENRHLWQDAVKGWAASAPDHIKPGTLKRYLCSLKQVRPYLDDEYLDRINRSKIAEIARRPGITNATRRRDLTAISVVLRWCVAQGWREDNPARDWDRSAIKERRQPIVLPQEEDIAAMVAEAPATLGRLIRFAQYTGMREEEIASLERSQVNPIRRAIDLSRTKRNRARSVPLDDRAAGTYAGTVPHLRSAYVFWHGDGDRYANLPSRFAAISRRTAEKAKKVGRPFRRFRFHDLRHWFAVDYLRRGGSIYDLQKILGHKSIRTTELYLDYLTPAEQERAKRVGALGAGTNPGTDITVRGDAAPSIREEK